MREVRRARRPRARAGARPDGCPGAPPRGTALRGARPSAYSRTAAAVASSVVITVASHAVTPASSIASSICANAAGPSVTETPAAPFTWRSTSPGASSSPPSPPPSSRDVDDAVAKLEPGGRERAVLPQQCPLDDVRAHRAMMPEKTERPGCRPTQGCRSAVSFAARNAGAGVVAGDEALLGEPAAVDRQGDAVDVRGEVAREVQRRVRDVSRLAVAALRDGRRQARSKLPSPKYCSVSGVRISPGQIAFTRMPSAARSRARLFVSPTTPCFAAVYAGRCDSPIEPADGRDVHDRPAAGLPHCAAPRPGRRRRCRSG